MGQSNTSTPITRMKLLGDANVWTLNQSRWAFKVSITSSNATYTEVENEGNSWPDRSSVGNGLLSGFSVNCRAKFSAECKRDQTLLVQRCFALLLLLNAFSERYEKPSLRPFRIRKAERLAQLLLSCIYFYVYMLVLWLCLCIACSTLFYSNRKSFFFFLRCVRGGWTRKQTKTRVCQVKTHLNHLP